MRRFGGGPTKEKHMCSDRHEATHGHQHDGRISRRRLLEHLLAGLGVAVLQPGLRASGDARHGAATSAEAFAAAARALSKSLSAEQRAAASFAFADDRREDWHYIPKPRKGVSYKQLDPGQRRLADALLATGLSPNGRRKVETIRSLEPILNDQEQGRGPVRDAELYYVCLFGEPRASTPWGWSLEGHHVSLNFTVSAGGLVASTPSFLGANPAEVRHGPRTGLRALAAEEDLARTLVTSLDEEQRARAVVDANAPGEIITANSRKAERMPEAGLPAKMLSGRQAELLTRLLGEYAGTMSASVAAARMAKVRAAGVDNVRFAWAGGLERGRPHYYRIQGPTFVVEYDNTQSDANHIHSVWRDFDGDFGADLLADHYETSHR
jgi:hypothetical protein